MADTEVINAENSANLNELFNKVKYLCNSVEKSDLDFNSDEFQGKVEICRQKLEELTVFVSEASLFSSNETIADIPTEYIKFLLLPSMLGNVTLKRKSSPPFMDLRDGNKNGSNADNLPPNQTHLLKLAKIYYRDFLTRCKDYGMTSAQIPQETENIIDSNSTKPKGGQPTPQELYMMGCSREEKIRRYKEKKSIEEKLCRLEKDLANADEETKREYYFSLINEAVINSLDELENAIREEKMLTEMAALRMDPKKLEELSNQPKPCALKPFLISRDSAQKAVYGAGYPSLPVLTVDEFYEKRKKEGWGPGAVASKPTGGCGGSCGTDCNSVVVEHGAGGGCCGAARGRSSPPPAPRGEDSEGEQNSDEENNEEKRNRLAARDEYRDMHRRGWGNTYNRS